MLQKPTMSQSDIVDSLNSNLKLLDINISFDSRYPTIKCVYFDIQNKKEIIDTFQAFSISLESEDNNRYTKHNENFYDIHLKASNICFIAREINDIK